MRVDAGRSLCRPQTEGKPAVPLYTRRFIGTNEGADWMGNLCFMPAVLKRHAGGHGDGVLIPQGLCRSLTSPVVSVMVHVTHVAGSFKRQ